MESVQKGSGSSKEACLMRPLSSSGSLSTNEVSSWRTYIYRAAGTGTESDDETVNLLLEVRFPGSNLSSGTQQRTALFRKMELGDAK